MKKLLAITVALFMLLLGGCKSNAEQTASLPTNPNGTAAVDLPKASSSSEAASFDNSGEVIEIKEKMFIAQINDIYLNGQDYLGKTIRYEGIYDEYYDEAGDTTYRYVIRYGPGCCGNDGNAGFEIVWDGEMPQDTDWVRLEGVLEAYEYNGWQFLCVNVSYLEVLQERGAEYVTQ
ncbi:MAG: hypothetical protein ACK5JF_05575 [Oscillospiraceae bacterium]